MRHLLYDDSSDKILIAHLQTENKEKSEKLAKAEAENLALRNQVVSLLQSPVSTATPSRNLTKDDVASKLGLPLWAVDQIDWDRFGTQFKGVDFGKKE